MRLRVRVARVLFAALLLGAARADALEPLASTCGALYVGVVANGFANYEKLAQHPARKACLDAIAEANLSSSTVNERIAFWANAYNLLTLLAIADEPLRWSPQENNGAVFRDYKFTVAGKQLTLDELELRELASLTRDPRVEFLLSCGARSCALLPPSLLAGDGIEAGMELGAKRWFARRDNLRIDREAGTVELGQLLAPDWHGGDFERAGIPLVDLVARFLPASDPKAAEDLKNGRLRLVFRPYDWRTNRLPRAYALP